jgi:hypothetical protein
MTDMHQIHTEIFLAVYSWPASGALQVIQQTHFDSVLIAASLLQ